MKIFNRDRKLRRKRRVSSNIKGTAVCPRISVFRSNRYIYAQAIDDEKKVTLASFSSKKIEKSKEAKKMNKSEEAKSVGVELASQLKKLNIENVVFDRSFYAYAGRVSALATGLREGNIKI